MRWTYRERPEAFGTHIIDEMQMNAAYASEDGCECGLGL